MKDYNQIVNTFLKGSHIKDVVYHGTRRKFDVFFKSNAFGSARYRTEGGKLAGNRQMFFFTDNPHVAGTYAGKIARGYDTVGPNIIPAYLCLKNPLIVDAKGGSWRETFDDVVAAYDSGKYDGAIILNTVDVNSWKEKDAITSNVYVTFNTQKILSSVSLKAFTVSGEIESDNFFEDLKAA